MFVIIICYNRIMFKINFLIFISIFIFLPGLVCASVAEDFFVNNQPVYAIPRTTAQVLILDLTLPEPTENSFLQLKSIKIHNAGTAVNADITKMVIWEDGSSPGWDNDEVIIKRVLSSPFWDTEILCACSAQRIFVTVDISSTAGSERTIKPQLSAASGDSAAIQFTTSTANGPTNTNVVGFERTILAGASHPTAPVAPLIKTSEAISTTTIRWNFLDLSNNEFGFKILDSNLNIVARSETADISYLDETNLEPNTEYSGRRVVAFNDRGESSFSAIFPAISTLAAVAAEEEAEVEEEVVEEEVGQEPEEVAEEVVEEEVEEIQEVVEKAVREMTVLELKTKIQEIQKMIIDLISQLIQLLQLQINA